MFENLNTSGSIKMAVAKYGVRVVKSSGDTENFDPNVIMRECVEAGIGFYTAAEVAQEVAREVYDGISTRDLQQETLEALARKSPEDAERYRQFHSMKVRTSDNTIESFDRKKITRSLLQETRIPQEVAENVAREAEDELRRLKLDFISGPLIREIVNVKLLEHGLEEARADYTRLGMPVYDATRLIEIDSAERANLHNPETIHKLMADNIFREYTLLKVLPLDLADAHMRGDIHIHDLEYFPTRPYCGQHDLRWFLRTGLKVDGTGKHTSVAGPAKKAEVAVLHAAKVLAAAQTNFAGGQDLDFFNLWLAPYLEGLDYPRIKQLAQMCIYEISQMYVGRGGQTVFSDIDIEYGCPSMVADVPAVLPGGIVRDRVTYGDFEEEARLFARALTEVYLEGDHTGKPFSFPRPNYKLRKEDLKKEGYDDFMVQVHETAVKYGTPYFLNLHADYLPDNTFAQGGRLLLQPDREDLEDLMRGTLRTGSLQVVSVNLPRIAYEAAGDDSKFYQILEERMEMAKRTIEVKRDIIRSRLEGGHLPFLSQDVEGEPYYRINRAVHSLGYVGVNEMCRAFTGHEMHQDEAAWRFGLKVVGYMSEATRRWSEETGLRWVLSQSPAESTAYRLAKLDYGRFSSRAVVQGDREAGSIYYTNSSHVRVDARVPLMERLRLEGAFHPLNTGGMMAQVCMEEANPSPEAMWEQTRRIAKDTLIGYWTYTCASEEVEGYSINDYQDKRGR